MEVQAPRRLFPWRAVVLPFVVSRLIADALILVMAVARPAATRGIAETPLFAGFAKWDGAWYIGIARNGYAQSYVPGTESPWPFFPLLPAIIRVGHWFGPSEALVGVAVNHVAFLLGLAGLYRIARRHFDDRASTLAVWAIALFPASIMFSMVYPSAIIFAGSVWAFDFVEDRRDVAAAAAALAAVMVRPNGFLVAVALAFAVGWRLKRVLVVCGPSLVAFGAWCLYNLQKTDDALTFFKAKDGWPEITLVDFALRDRKIAIPHVLLALAAAAAVIVVWRKLPKAWLVLTGLFLVLPFFTGMVGLGRYAGETFPPFVAAGDILRRWPPWAVRTAFAASVVGMAVCTYWVIYLDYLP
ncbi:MAG: hypothetical protein FJW95_03290 [Actinobacteria bacterium]|nr:hypothetical protein [Actinomycetota bacterium]